MAARVQEYALPYKENVRCAVGRAWWGALCGGVRSAVLYGGVAKKFLLGPRGR